MCGTRRRYPDWSQTVLSIFACYKLDTGAGAYAENQRATWPHGYWLLDMKQRCYAGVHWRLYLPLGLACVVLICALPPAMAAWLVVRHRRELHAPHVAQMYRCGSR